MLSSSSSSIPRDNDGLHQEASLGTSISPSVAVYTRNTPEILLEHEQEDLVVERKQKKRREREEGDQLSLLAVLVTVFRKSLVSSYMLPMSPLIDSMAFLASLLNLNLKSPEDPLVPVCRDHNNLDAYDPDDSIFLCSTRVFGVSTECMQLSFDSRGNCVPTILLMMQGRLYTQGGLQAEGIFRINAENGQEEMVREQLNSGIVPNDIDVHCLAGLIKAWFRELPRGVLDSLSPEEVMHAQSEEECVRLVRLLPPTEASLLDWAINLMADVAEMEQLNKMNARNIAMVFAPNMTQMADPLTALMYAVQVMNFLKILIERTLQDREECIIEAGPAPDLEPFDENGHHSTAHPTTQEENESDRDEEQNVQPEKTSSDGATEEEAAASGFLSSIENILPGGNGNNVRDDDHPGEILNQSDETRDGSEGGNAVTTSVRVQSKPRRAKSTQSSSSNPKKASNKRIISELQAVKNAEKNKEVSILDRLNSQTERIEAWR
nr:rho GTPase-activating protein 5-like [Ipomoea batatas]